MKTKTTERKTRRIKVLNSDDTKGIPIAIVDDESTARTQVADQDQIDELRKECVS